MTTRRTSSFRWNSDTLRKPLSQWPTDLECSNETSADDFSDVDVEQRYHKGSRYESDLSDVGESFENRRSFPNRRTFVVKKMSYDSDSCLTPRSRRTLRRSLSSSTDEPWNSNAPAKDPELSTIFSPTHEILHPLQSLRLERSLSRQESRKSVVKSDAFPLPKPPPSPQPPGKFDSYSYRSHSLSKSLSSTVEEEKLEQKESLIDSVVGKSLSAVKSEMEISTPNIVVIIVDAEKTLTFFALNWAINVAARPGDEVVLLGVLKHISSPMGYKLVANTDPLYGVNRAFLQSEVDKTTESFQSSVSKSGIREACEKKKVKLSIRIAPGARSRTVVVRELRALGASYAVFDRKAMRSRRYYAKHLSCHAVRMRRNGLTTRTITHLLPSKKTRSPTSDMSSVSSSMASSNDSSRSPTLWRRITSFGSSRRGSCRGSPGSSPTNNHLSDLTSPGASEMVMHQDDFRAMKSLHLPDAPGMAYAYKGMRSHRTHLPVVAVAVPPAIRAN